MATFYGPSLCPMLTVALAKGEGPIPNATFDNHPKGFNGPSWPTPSFFMFVKGQYTCIHIYKYQYQAKLPVSPTHFQLKHHPLTRHIDPYASQPLDHSCL